MTLITEDQVRTAEDKLLDAIKVSDVVTLEQLLHKDLLFTTPDGGVVTREMDLSSHRAGTMVVDAMEVSAQEIRIIGDNAVVTMIMKTKGRMMGDPIQGKFRFIRIWKFVDDRLQVIGGSCIQMSME
jgi:hypothetical protein